MNKDYSKIKLDKFDSKLKFYFSLLFMSNEDYSSLKKTFNNSIDIFDNNKYIDDNKINTIKTIIDNIYYNYNNINLEDNVLSRLFLEDELINYHNLYLQKYTNLDLDDAESLENFLCFCMLNKVEEKKNIKTGTLYDLFDPISKEEVKKAISNLNGYDHEQFTMYYGINYDKKVKINTNDKISNDLLIKLYTYILTNKEDTDIAVILKMVSKDLIKDYDLYDFIRRMCNDNNLTNQQIENIISKLSYEDKVYLKMNYGKDYKEKKKAPKDDNFKQIVNKIVKEVKKDKKKKSSKKEEPKKKKVASEEKKKDKKQEKKEDKKVNNKKDNKKKESKKEEPKKKTTKKEEKIKEKKKQEKEEPKKEVKKEDKKKRLDMFLSEYNLDKKEFLLAVAMLDLVSKKIIELYFGLKKDKEPIDMDEIALKINRSLDACIDLYELALEKIVNLVKTGQIYKSKKEEKKDKNDNKKVIKAPKGIVTENKLNSFITENNISKEKIEKEVNKLSSLPKIVVGMYLGLNATSKDVNEISKDLSIPLKSVNNILDDATNVLISKLSVKEEKEIKKPVIVKKEEVKKEEKKDNKDKNKKIIRETLESFLKENNISKEEFNYGFKKLEPFAKKIISLYFSSYSKEELAKRYNMTIEQVDKLISNSKKKIVSYASELKKQKSNMTLKKFLNDNGISLTDFNKYFKTLSPIKQNVLSMYLGLKGNPLTIEEISKRTYRSVNAIKDIIAESSNDIKKKVNNDLKKENRLQEFLRVNKLTKEQFNENLKLLPEINVLVISMYLGLNGKERQIGDIAKITNLSKVDVINIISESKKVLANKEKQKDKITKDDIISRVRNSFMKVSFNKDIIAMLSLANPLAIQMLSVIINNNVTIDDLSKMFNIPKENVNNILNSTVLACENFSNNMSNNISNYQDEPNKNKSK